MITFTLILRKFRSKISRPTQIQIPILNVSNHFQTCCFMFLIEQDLLFYVSYMADLRSVALENYDEITKKIRQNRKFRVEKWNFRIFLKLFPDHWNMLYNLQLKVFGHINVFWKPYFRHVYPYRLYFFWEKNHWFIANSLIRNKIIVSNLSKIIALLYLELHPKNDKSFLFIGQSGIKLVSSGLRIFQNVVR